METKMSEDKFYNDLAFRESSGRWDVVNYAGYLGAFQMGEVALEEAGYYIRNSAHKGDENNYWDGVWTGKDNIWSKQDYLNSPTAQKNAAKIFHKKTWQYIRNLNLHKYIGKNVNGIEITPSGLIAGSHSSLGNLKKFLVTNGRIDGADGNGTKISSYLKRFANYDTYSVTKIPTWEKYKKDLSIDIPKYSPNKVVNKYNDKMFDEISKENEYYTKKYREYKEHVNNVIEYGEKADYNHKAFLEGFDSGILGSGEKQKNNNKKDDSSNNSKKAHWTDKFNIGNPETDKGHWVTLDNGKHIFIKDT